MKTRAVVLGCGMVGATMARDLAADAAFEVTVADVREGNLRRLGQNPTIHTRCIDLAEEARVREFVAEFDLVLGAMPSALGFQTLRAVVDAGKRYADISFMSENAFDLSDRAKASGAVAVIDCGVAPGFSNMIAGYEASVLDKTLRADIFVGGLPKARMLPFQYKAPFAPSDVIEEYTRPARLVENGQVITRPALSESEPLDFPAIGTLEAFNTDGLRSLIFTMNIPHMREKTLRYPGHIDLMRAFRETGLFEKEPIDVAGINVRPIDLTARLLFPKWTYQPGEEEFTVLRAYVEGVRGGHSVRIAYDLYDETDRPTGTTSMARTTAFPCTAMARMLASERFHEPGVWAPEQVAARPGLFETVLRELRDRGVRISREESVLPHG
ncbi:MAG: saccharopine dehydrogenase NADP-binding domain-containing protein [Phycisphaerae bacterium]|nr:saccharopine dehydrogenase NADP-binding domain-containing protein [Phycisphaerae bacterium]